jgi:two-component system nitrate/nitrite response regulator NarL
MALETPSADELAIDVVLAIDNEFMRNGMKYALRGIPEVANVRTGTVAGETMSAAGDPWKIIIISMAEWRRLDPEATGPDPRPKVIVLLHEQQIHEVEALEGPHVDGFLMTTDLSRQSLQETIRRTMTGDLPMPAALARTLLKRSPAAGHRTASRPLALTSRESETLGLLIDGYSNKQIARSLGISIHGAKRLVAAVLLKLGAPNRTAAVVTALKRGLA